MSWNRDEMTALRDDLTTLRDDLTTLQNENRMLQERVYTLHLKSSHCECYGIYKI